MEELLSVIVPVHNEGTYLKQCVDSILNQTYKNIEVILVNDGSTDHSGQICDEYAAKDRRVKVIHQNNKGAISARKAALTIARGDYVGFVDADDWIAPQMYETLLKLAQQFGAAVVDSGIIDTYVYGATYLENRRHAFYSEGYYSGERFEKEIVPTIMYTGSFFQNGITPHACSKIFKTKLFYEFLMQMDETGYIWDDAFCTYSSIVKAESLYITHQCFYHYRAVSDSLKRTYLRNADQIIRNRFLDLKKIFGQFKHKDVLSQQLIYNAMHLLIWHAPYAFDDGQLKCLVPYGGIERGSKIVLYGAGAVGIHLYHYIKESKCCHIVGWADKNYTAISDFDIISPARISDLEFDYLVISILNRNAYLSAKKDLISMGIEEKKIRWIDDKYLENPVLLIEQTSLKDVFS